MRIVDIHYGKKVCTTDNGDGTIRINNSKDIHTPWVAFGYAFYLNHYSEHKDTIKGSSFGVWYEWELHNIAYYGAAAGELIGINTEKYKDSAEHVDVGGTIFDDTTHGAMGDVMKITYTGLCLPIAAVDFLVFALK